MRDLSIYTLLADLEVALDTLDVLDAHLPGAHLSLAIETLRNWASEREVAPSSTEPKAASEPWRIDRGGARGDLRPRNEARRFGPVAVQPMGGSQDRTEALSSR